MSLHVNLSPEAAERLRAQKRNSTVFSVVIAALVLILVGLLLQLYLLPSLTRDISVIVTYELNSIEEPETPDRIPVETQRKPAAPSPSMVRVITADMASPTFVHMTEAEVESLSSEFGAGDDFGSAWPSGESADAGKETAFGSTSARRDALSGSLYDFKKKPNGEDIPYKLDQVSEFADRAVRLQRSRFSDASLNRYFRAPNRLYLSHLAIANSPAEKGPEYFGAKDSIRPSGWVAAYRGRIAAPRSGFYRFSGLGDDYLVVMLKGRVCLSACWPTTQDHVRGRWDPFEPSGKYKSPYDGGVPLIFGDWVKLEAGEPVDMIIAIGERPGGKVGFVLNIEERGREYRKAPDGRPILPLFSIGPISDEEQARITKDFGSFEFEWDDVPVFEAR